MKKRKSLPIYLDDYEKQVLHSIASAEGVSMSSVIQKYLRTHPNAQRAEFVALRVDPFALKRRSINDIGEASSEKGIYFLFYGDASLAYVGQSQAVKGFNSRFKSHHKLKKNSISFFACISIEDESEISAIEADFISIYKPDLNEQSPAGHAWAGDLCDRDMEIEIG